LGAQPAFAVPPYELRTPLELPLYLLLGVLAAVVAVAYTRAVHTLEYRGAQSRLPRPLRTALGGLMVGLAAGLFFPQLFGVGYETIERVLQGEHFPVALLGGLLVFKILLTALSLGMGFVGGVFAPSLFLGAMLGGLYGEVLSRVLPGMVAVPAAYAMVGMAAVLAGTIRAPLTATLILFEMTRDYRIILPLLAAVGVSVLIGERLLPGSIYLLSLRRRGINLVRGRDIDVMQGIAVEEAMSKEFIAFSRHTPLSEARTVLDRGHHHAGIVLDETGELFGIVSINDIERMLAGAGASSPVNGTSGAPVDKDAGLSTPQTVGEICTRDVTTVFPDEPMGVALRRMAGRDVGRLPVVSRSDPRRVLGVVRRSDIVRAYNLAIIRKTAVAHRAAALRLGTLTGAEVLEIRLTDGSPAVGKRLADVSLPGECLIASVRRGRQVLVPSGRTELQAGDVLVAVCNREMSGALRDRLTGGSAASGSSSL
jgi:CIC family chloride channel protein